MTTPTPEAIEYTPPVVDIQLFYSAGRLGLGVRALESRKEMDRAIAAITAQAKAEALREAAESFQGVMIGIGGRDPRTSGAAWLRARAELIERKGS